MTHLEMSLAYTLFCIKYDREANVNFYNVEYFLNHFKIPFDDIV